MTKITIRCQAKTEDAFRQIVILTEERAVTCSCNNHTIGLFCAHIDAVVLAGERHMVPTDDRANADKAMSIMAGHLVPPTGWKGSWRSQMAWRGLSKPRNVINHKDFYGDDYNDRPSICFTGQGPIPRPELLEQARELGWRAVDTVVRGLKVLVAEDPTLNTTKLRDARKKGIPIISYGEYQLLTAEGELIDN
ncbi:hypothetical protein QTL95_01610 [Rhizobium sp. S152]|uniref:hypothetical protein n=1 Tax=Rhizobium sp. S152 TaxID=3055038 RepID=UPI0025A973D1|nr:hypothetical protein [Rhizobium sp. S152]MDM9624573.1 hypothetical protein [Rhizobium sp. S152]